MAEKKGGKPSDLLARMGRSMAAPAPITTELQEAASHDGDPAEEARLAGVLTTPAEPSAPPLREPVPPTPIVEAAPFETPPVEPVPPAPTPEAAPFDSPPEPTAPAAPRRAPRAKGDKMPRRLPGPKDSVRFSLDLERTRHKEFKTFSLLEAEIDAAVVGRVLVEMMLEDPALKARVLARVAQMKSDYLESVDSAGG